MRRLTQTRKLPTDLLARPPCGRREIESGWAALIVDPVSQLAELAQLFTRGLLSSEEFERQKAKVVWPDDAVSERSSGVPSRPPPPAS
jgi:putative oligomerization/nucleic acid binding protein